MTRLSATPRSWLLTLGKPLQLQLIAGGEDESHYAIATECNRILLPDRPEVPGVSGLTSCRHP
jgi:hypothetical protein